MNECMEIGGSTLPFHTLIDPSSHSSFTSNHPFPLPSPLFSSLDRLIGGREKLKKRPTSTAGKERKKKVLDEDDDPNDSARGE